MVRTKHYLKDWSKERLIEEVIKLDKSNMSLVNKLINTRVILNKADKMLELY